jgi:hypothetical protein
MSIRETMRKLSQDAKEVISSYKYQRADLDKTIAALEYADKVLSGEPRAETKTALLIHYDRPSRFISVADCLECGAELEGYKINWKCCPVCTSSVVDAKQENDPNDRLTRKALQEVLKPLTLAGGTK